MWSYIRARNEDPVNWAWKISIEVYSAVYPGHPTPDEVAREFLGLAEFFAEKVFEIDAKAKRFSVIEMWSKLVKTFVNRQVKANWMTIIASENRVVIWKPAWDISFGNSSSSLSAKFRLRNWCQASILHSWSNEIFCIWFLLKWHYFTDFQLNFC